MTIPLFEKFLEGRREGLLAPDFGKTNFLPERFSEHPRIISLSGFAGAGKDTVGHILANYHYRPLKFAEPVYQSLEAIDPLITWQAGREPKRVSEIVERIGWDEAKRTIPEIRRLLQRVGTEMGRELFGEDFWVNQLLRKVHSGGKYVITDTRFPNEFAALARLGALMVWIYRPGVDAVNDHASEHSLTGANFHWILPNDDSVEKLHAHVDTMVLRYENG